MCFRQPKAPPPPPIPPTPAPPVRADEENRRSVNAELDDIRRRQGRSSTVITGGLGDTGFGTNVAQKTLLGQ